VLVLDAAVSQFPPAPQDALFWFCIDGACQNISLWENHEPEWAPSFGEYDEGLKYCQGNCTNTCSCVKGTCVWDKHGTVSCGDCHSGCSPDYV
jgi:hypothetical protein